MPTMFTADGKPSTAPPRRPSPVGTMLRDWRQDRRRSQLELALDVGVSTRHLSFVETGRSKPSPELVLAIAEHLAVPLRERNTMLLAAGYAPRFPHTPLDDEAMGSVRVALDQLLQAHDPYPAVVVDRHWNMVMANSGALGLVEAVADHLVEPPVNVYRATLHPEGMARHIENLGEWAHALLATLDRQVAITRDPTLRALLDEVSAYPDVAALGPAWRTRSAVPALVANLRLRRADGTVQSWFSTNTAIGTPADITLDELHVELFHPADRQTADAARVRTSASAASVPAIERVGAPERQRRAPARRPAWPLSLGESPVGNASSVRRERG